jgi:hypothetical protein
MNKSSKKFKNNDWFEDDEDEDEEIVDNRSRYLEKKKNKLVNKALKTKDISLLTSEDYDDLFDGPYYKPKR